MRESDVKQREQPGATGVSLMWLFLFVLCLWFSAIGMMHVLSEFLIFVPYGLSGQLKDDVISIGAIGLIALHGYVLIGLVRVCVSHKRLEQEISSRDSAD